MRKVQLEHATKSVLLIVAASVIVFAGLRSWVTAEAPSDKGANLFQEKGCSQCHFTDSRKTKIGPGLEGLFNRERLPLSGRAVTEQNVKQQMIDPFENMPSFADRLTDREVDAIVAHLKTL